MSVAEIFGLMCQSAREKAAKHRTNFLTDNEVHLVCLQCGLQKFRDRSGKELTAAHEVFTSLPLLVFTLSVPENAPNSSVETVCVLGVRFL